MNMASSARTFSRAGRSHLYRMTIIPVATRMSTSEVTSTSPRTTQCYFPGKPHCPVYPLLRPDIQETVSPSDPIVMSKPSTLRNSPKFRSVHHADPFSMLFSAQLVAKYHTTLRLSCAYRHNVSFGLRQTRTGRAK